jgi:probable phosphoglycerate mutase
MRLLLIRHAPTAETGRLLSGRAPGIPLSSEGRAAAELVADRLSAHPIAAVYTSPLQRCRETAAAIAGRHGLRPQVDRRLIEVDYGQWSGRRLRQLMKLKSWQALLDTPSRFAFPGGSETLLEAQERVVTGLENIAGRHSDQLVAAVTHNDAIRLALAHYLGMPLDLFHRLHVGPASVTIIDLEPGRPPRVPVVNHGPLTAER